MNVICPICGKDHTVPFSDSVYKTCGFECSDCKKDFGVDDGKTIKEHIDSLGYFSFTHKLKNGTTEKVVIMKNNDKAVLKMSFIDENKFLHPYQDIDFTASFTPFIEMLFKKLFILDWKRDSLGILTGNDESFEIEMRYNLNKFDDTIIKGTNSFPVYFKALDTIFSSLFEGSNE